MKSTRAIKPNFYILKSKFWLGVGIAVIVSILCLCYQLIQPTTMPITLVKVSGEYRQTGEKAIENTARPWVEGSFFSIDLHALKYALMQLPWVAYVEIERKWPDTVAILIREEVPFAIWNERSLLNAEGKVFHPDVNTIPSTLPKLSGPDDKVQLILEGFLQAKKIVKALELDVLQFACDERSSLRLVLSNDIEVVLGRQEPMKRLERFVQLYDVIIGSNSQNARRVDLRYASGFTVDWK